jgi:hypothetical protein
MQKRKSVYEFFSRLLGVDVDQNVVGGLPLAAVAGYRASVVEMRVAFEVERHCAV